MSIFPTKILLATDGSSEGRAAHGLRDAVDDLRLEEANRPLPELVESLVEHSGSMNPGAT